MIVMAFALSLKKKVEMNHDFILGWVGFSLIRSKRRWTVAAGPIVWPEKNEKGR